MQPLIFPKGKRFKSSRSLATLEILVILTGKFHVEEGSGGGAQMTQAQLATYLADKVGIERKQGKAVLDELTALVVKQLKKEGELRLSGLGVFRKRKTKARVGRNPATGEQIKIPARTRLRFTPAKALKDAVLGAR
jgi:DNA-binding protein HU-beta